MDVSKYKNKKILIVGGGQSTLDTKWENLDYDYLWTCNDFYKEERVLSQDIDLYALAFTTKLRDFPLIKKLRKSNTTVIYEPIHYRGKENSEYFQGFKESIKIPIKAINLPLADQIDPDLELKEFIIQKRKDLNWKDGNGVEYHRTFQRPALKSGIAFRLILLALTTEASSIYFVGFDGFNEKFTNIHAFTKYQGLKNSDTRRVFKGGPEGYYEVFTDAYQILYFLDEYGRLQNIGEGFDYNIGTHISKKYFPLRKELYEKTR